MLEAILLGGGFAFAAAVQPGPLQAFLLARVAELGWRRVLPAALSPVISDGPIAVLIVALLKNVPGGALRMLQAVGGALLLYLAWTTFRRLRKPPPPVTGEAASGPRTLMQAVAVNFLNPGPYIGWSLVLGPEVLDAWGSSPAAAVVLVAAFYCVMVVMLGVTIVLFGATRFMGPRGQRALLLASAFVLAALGVYRLVAAVLPPRSA